MEGVTLYELQQITVKNGDIFHALKSTDAGYAGFGEAYFSQIQPGTIKGWKKHIRLRLNIIVPAGKIKFVIYDDRKYSSTFGQFEEYTLSPSGNYKRLVLEPGLWMAFMGLDNTTSILLDIIPEPHDPNEAKNLPLDSIPYKFRK